jgi:cob(I)alamin adenosyltransferase
MISVYTKTGDSGESGLANGKRMGKEELIFDVLGTLDELNSHLGLCVVVLPNEKKLIEIQDTLFYLGAEIAGSKKAILSGEKSTHLEKLIDSLQKEMGDNWYQKFLLPGGSEAAARLDIARTVCRRCERLIVTYSKHSSVSPEILKYINRLSDYLYVLRCYVNLIQEKKEKVFIPVSS